MKLLARPAALFVLSLIVMTLTVLSQTQLGGATIQGIVRSKQVPLPGAIVTAVDAANSKTITAVTEVLGLKEREYQLQDILVFRQEGMAADRIQGRHVFTGYQPSFIGAAKNRGFDVAALWSS